MNRRQLLYRAVALGGAVAMRLPVFADARDYTLRDVDPEELGQATPLQTIKLTDNLSVIMGAGGNIAVFNTGHMLLQVDSGLKERADDIAKAVKAIDDKSPGILINTHWHMDHTGGNESLGKAGCNIIGHAQTRARLSTDQEVEFLKMKFPASPTAALPVMTFNDTSSLFLEGSEVVMTHVDPAHTDSDIYVHFKKENVIHAGDLMFNGFYPFIDYSTKGWIGGMLAGADTMLKVARADTKIIPGHGPIATKADLQAFRDMLHEVQTRIAAQLAAGKKPPEIAAAKPLNDLDAKWGGGFLKADMFIACVAEGLARHKA